MAGEVKGDGSGRGFLVGLCLAVVVGAGAGFGAVTAAKGRWQNLEAARPAVTAPASEHGAAPALAGAADADTGTASQEAVAEPSLVLAIDPVVVSLTGSPRAWVRIEGAAVFPAPPGKNQALMLAEIAQDISGFLRSASLGQFESAASVEFMREDIAEIVKLRSRQPSAQFILKSLVIE